MSLSPISFSVLSYQTRLPFWLLTTIRIFSSMKLMQSVLLTVWTLSRPPFSNPGSSRNRSPAESILRNHLSSWSLRGLHSLCSPHHCCLYLLWHAFLSWILRNYAIEISPKVLQAMPSFALFFTNSLTSFGSWVWIISECSVVYLSPFSIIHCISWNWGFVNRLPGFETLTMTFFLAEWFCGIYLTFCSSLPSSVK